jgi:sugar-specific transcriptional regulator TrmB
MLSSLRDNNMDIKEILQESGFSLEETVIYLSSLELGAQPASVIAKKSGLKRGQTYNKLALLVQKGIMQEFVKDKVTYFTCQQPQTLISVLEHKQEEIEEKKRKLLSIVPFLNKIESFSCAAEGQVFSGS